MPPIHPITIRDVAKRAGVSVATVSRVLNHSALTSKETREQVLQAVAELGYRPNANAQALATQSSDTLGVVVMDVSDPFFGALVKAVDTVAQKHHKYLLIGNSYHQADKERHAIEVLIRQRCNALIVHAKALSDAELIGFLEQVPGMVLINRIIPGYEPRCVGLDNVCGAEMAMRLCCRRAIGASVIWAPITRSKTGRCASRLCAGDGRRRAGHARQLARLRFAGSAGRRGGDGGAAGA